MKSSELFKNLEHENERRLPEHGFSVLRLDGVNFKRVTAELEKPFSVPFERAMNEATIAVLKGAFPQALIAYVGSDEISIVLSNEFELPYAGRLEKLLTISAGYATAGFNRSIDELKNLALFDARVITFDDEELVHEYLTWRRLDVRKNATSMAAYALHSHKSLQGVSTRERGELLVGTEFEKINEVTFNGRFVTRRGGITAASREVTEELCEHALNEHRARIELKKLQKK